MLVLGRTRRHTKAALVRLQRSMPRGEGAAPTALALPRGFCRSVWVMVRPTVISQQPLSVTPECVDLTMKNYGLSQYFHCLLAWIKTT